MDNIRAMTAEKDHDQSWGTDKILWCDDASRGDVGESKWWQGNIGGKRGAIGQGHELNGCRRGTEKQLRFRPDNNGD
jgi:hypothetical protein